MDIRKGDRVLVNLAPFIGWSQRARQSISCQVLEVEADRTLVCAEYPCREVSLWIVPSWIDQAPETREVKPRSQRRYVVPVG